MCACGFERIQPLFLHAGYFRRAPYGNEWSIVRFRGAMVEMMSRLLFASHSIQVTRLFVTACLHHNTKKQHESTRTETHKQNMHVVWNVNAHAHTVSGWQRDNCWGCWSLNFEVLSRDFSLICLLLIHRLSRLALSPLLSLALARSLSLPHLSFGSITLASIFPSIPRLQLRNPRAG